MSDTLLFTSFCMRGKFYGILILPINSTIWRSGDLKFRHFVNLDVANDEYIILCNFGGCIMSCFETVEGGYRMQKKQGLNRVNYKGRAKENKPKKYRRGPSYIMLVVLN